MLQPASLVNLAAITTFSNAEWRWTIFCRWNRRNSPDHRLHRRGYFSFSQTNHGPHSSLPRHICHPLRRPHIPARIAAPLRVFHLARRCRSHHSCHHVHLRPAVVVPVSRSSANPLAPGHPVDARCAIGLRAFRDSIRPFGRRPPSSRYQQQPSPPGQLDSSQLLPVCLPPAGPLPSRTPRGGRGPCR